MSGHEEPGVSVAEFARQMGVAPNTVRDRVKSGRMGRAVLPDGKIDPVHGAVLWRKSTNPARTKMRKGDEKPPPSIVRDAEAAQEKASEYDLKIERMAVDLEAAKINLETLRKTSIDRSEAVAAVRALMRIHRNTILNFCNRYGSEIAAEVGCDERALIGALEARLRLALGEAADQPLPFGGDDEANAQE